MDTLQQLEQLMAEMHNKMQEAQSFMQAHSSQYIELSVQSFFDACPEIESIFWTQYTPYFNDGDSCEFSVHELHYTVEGLPSDDHEGSYLHTQSDYEAAIENLESVKRYVADPAAWIQTYKDEYLKRTGRALNVRDEHIYPYPKTVEGALEAIAEIEPQLNIISFDRVTEIESAYNTLCSVLSKIPEDTMRHIYGDHAQITITRSGTVVEEYSHD
jgi:hypothetical protein